MNEMDMTAIKIERMKEDVFNSLFTKRVVNYPLSREGQNVNSYLSINDGRLLKHYEKMKAKYGFRRSWMDLQSEYIFQAWESINKFEPVEGLKGWEEILNKTNQFEENKLISYIKKTATYKIYEFVNPDAFRTTTTEEGKRVHYTLVMEFESLDKLLTHAPDGEESIPLSITTENNVFDNTMYQYYITHFQKWYEERKEVILAKSQLEFLEKLRECSNEIYLTAEEFEEVTGVRWSDYSRRLKRIGERVYRAWLSENKTSMSRKQVYNTDRIKYLEGYMRIFNSSENLEEQNLRLTNYLIDGMNNLEVEYDVFEVTNEALKDSSLIEFNRIVQCNNENGVALPADSLYSITQQIKKKLEHLLKEQSIVIEEKEREKKEEVEEEKKERERSKVTTYNIKGEVVNVEYRMKDEPVKRNNIYYILPTGVHTNEIR